MLNLVIEYWYLYIKMCYKMSLKQRIKMLLKVFYNVYISKDSPEQDNFAFNIPVIIAKKNQINT